jgi:hypothetical protein
MNNYTNWSNAVQCRTRQLLDALLTYTRADLTNRNPDLIYTWHDERSSHPKLSVRRATLRAIAELTAQSNPTSPLTTTQVKEALERLEDLRILENRVSSQGVADWQFTLNLWSKQVISENLTQLNRAWENRPRSTRARDSKPLTIPNYAQALLKNKTEDFVGREYVFAAIQDFLENQSNGYFIVQAEPGAGKTSIIAKYLLRTECIAYFNIRAQGKNRTSQFLEDVCTQLCNRYNLPYLPLPQNANQNSILLSQLLEEASTKLKGDEKLVIAIDALDEVDIASQDTDANILYLPPYLPKNVYFVLTRRPKTDYSFVVQVPQQLLDLNRYPEESRQDVKEYIQRATQNPKLQHWLNQQLQTTEAFIEELSDKSESNFMYLHHVLQAIEGGIYQDLKIEHLPQGLQGYYEDHWLRMGMRSNPLPEIKIKIVYILSELSVAVSCKTISHYACESENLVLDILQKWKEFLEEDETKPQPHYSIYHASFRDFLNRRDVLQSAHVKLKKINALIAEQSIKLIEDFSDDD